jgi:hypothetical protein
MLLKLAWVPHGKTQCKGDPFWFWASFWWRIFLKTYWKFWIIYISCWVTLDESPTISETRSIEIELKNLEKNNKKKNFDEEKNTKKTKTIIKNENSISKHSPLEFNFQLIQILDLSPTSSSSEEKEKIQSKEKKLSKYICNKFEKVVI